LLLASSQPSLDARTLITHHSTSAWSWPLYCVSPGSRGRSRFPGWPPLPALLGVTSAKILNYLNHLNRLNQLGPFHLDIAAAIGHWLLVSFQQQADLSSVIANSLLRRSKVLLRRPSLTTPKGDDNFVFISLDWRISFPGPHLYLSTLRHRRWALNLIWIQQANPASLVDPRNLPSSHHLDLDFLLKRKCISASGLFILFFLKKILSLQVYSH